ncbi:ABC transporter substrate-binding protein [Actinomyces sp. MRS3W]|uniref:ABC transporter substrate-binding protein n=1 Tax=Actinomyces sp. MRS3W TaxID=2800796 RepID=UPI0028FD1097|nr:ABC transporter substrate-binding protein [Actinomyces sp. MRS3W]MDU0349259.1 ABC transporter substrate-binding protein [Actinomyces sp. MRS3W]
MSRRRGLSRRSLLVGAVVVGGASQLTACTEDGSSTAGPSAAAGNATRGATESFPITVEHAYGSTVIESEPTRIATVAGVDNDVVISLGIVPVGMPAVSRGADDNGAYPWTTEALEALNAGWDTEAAPTLYSEADGINTEEIAALAPDLILGVHSDMSEDDYRKLSTIAPTLAYPAGTVGYAASWKTTTTTIGRALGRSAAAEVLVNTTTDVVTSTKTANPALAGATYAAVVLDPDGPSITMYAASDSRSQLLTQLGLTLSPAAVAAGADTDDELTVAYPLESADELVADLLWVEAEDAAAVEAIEQDARLSAIPAIAEGTALFVTDATAAMSLAEASPLSLPWCCENHIPDVVAAVAASKAAATARVSATASAVASATAS